MNLKIPTLEDISPTKCLDLDEKLAVKYFLGKSQEEASELFMENMTYYEDFLIHMGKRAFSYYFPAIIPYIKSSESQYDADSVINVSEIIRMRLNFDNESIKISHDFVLEVLCYFFDNYEKFDPYPPRFKNLKTRVEKLIDRVKEVV